MRKAVATGWMIAGLVAFAGCTDDEERLSADEFREQANEICTEGSEALDARIEEAIGDVEEEPTAEEMEELVEVVTEEVENQVDAIRDLNPPEDMEDDVDAALDSAEADLEELRDEGAEAFASEEDPFAETNALLVELGLDACGES